MPATLATPAFAKWTFRVAGIYGLLVTLPMFFTERKLGIDFPPAVTHPEFYYGFAGLCLAWQLAFLLISTDPLRYRPLMLICIVEKASFAIAVPLLHAADRMNNWQLLGASLIDAMLGILFAAAFFLTSPTRGPKSV